MNARHVFGQFARFALVIALFALNASSTFAAPGDSAPTGAGDIIVIGG